MISISISSVHNFHENQINLNMYTPTSASLPKQKVVRGACNICASSECFFITNADIDDYLHCRTYMDFNLTKAGFQVHHVHQLLKTKSVP